MTVPLSAAIAFVRALGRRLPRARRLQSLFESNHLQEPHYYIRYLGVATRFQGQGLGTALLRPTLDRCDAEGVAAYLEASTERSAALYERLGFIHLGELRVPDGPASGRCDAHRKPLSRRVASGIARRETAKTSHHSAAPVLLDDARRSLDAVCVAGPPLQFGRRQAPARKPPAPGVRASCSRCTAELLGQQDGRRRPRGRRRWTSLSRSRCVTSAGSGSGPTTIRRWSASSATSSVLRSTSRSRRRSSSRPPRGTRSRSWLLGTATTTSSASMRLGPSHSSRSTTCTPRVASSRLPHRGRGCHRARHHLGVDPRPRTGRQPVRVRKSPA